MGRKLEKGEGRKRRIIEGMPGIEGGRGYRRSRKDVSKRRRRKRRIKTRRNKKEHVN